VGGGCALLPEEAPSVAPVQQSAQTWEEKRNLLIAAASKKTAAAETRRSVVGVAVVVGLGLLALGFLRSRRRSRA
jgi:hypothetical protein